MIGRKLLTPQHIQYYDNTQLIRQFSSFLTRHFHPCTQTHTICNHDRTLHLIMSLFTNIFIRKHDICQTNVVLFRCISQSSRLHLPRGSTLISYRRQLHSRNQCLLYRSTECSEYLLQRQYFAPCVFAPRKIQSRANAKGSRSTADSFSSRLC